jgi:hypothetical protein
MILSYKPQFVPKWQSGQKLHTIRRDPHNRWHAGRVAQFAIGVRTKNYKQFDERVCTGTQPIIIEHDVHAIGDTVVVIDEQVLSPGQVLLLAKNDGFDSVDDFYAWFNKDFIGKILHFTDLRY